MKNVVKKYRSLLTLILDILIIILGYIVAIVFLNTTDDISVTYLLKGIGIHILFYQMFLNIFGLYQNLLEYEVGKDYIKYIFVAVFSIVTISTLGIIFQLSYISFKINVLAGIFIAGMLIVYRLFLRSFFNKNKILPSFKHKAPNNLLIIGAGMGAREIIIAILNNMQDKYNIIVDR